MSASIRSSVALAGLALGLGAGASAAHAAPRKQPPRITAAVVNQVKHQDRYKRFSHLSPATKGLVREGRHDGPGRLRGIPSFSDAFTVDGVSYPYTMAGRAPRRGGETRIDTSLIAISFKFDEFADAQGNSLVIGTQDIVGDVVGSPNFVRSEYSVGRAQFGDAVQKASFFNVAERDWHTTLERPRQLTPVTIEVPVGMAQVFDIGGGRQVAIVNGDFLFSQIQTILQLEPIRTDELPILVSHNVFADFALGFHDAFEVTDGNRHGIQTYTWTSWLDVDAFGPIFADATTLTHEISEWISDPFINNETPGWILPGSSACLNILEVGDPIELLDTQMFPVTINGKLYHTQNEATLSWFARDVPSKSFGGGYSYPDTTVLTAPSQSCTP